MIYGPTLGQNSKGQTSLFLFDFRMQIILSPWKPSVQVIHSATVQVQRELGPENVDIDAGLLKTGIQQVPGCFLSFTVSLSLFFLNIHTFPQHILIEREDAVDVLTLWSILLNATELEYLCEHIMDLM